MNPKSAHTNTNDSQPYRNRGCNWSNGHKILPLLSAILALLAGPFQTPLFAGLTAKNHIVYIGSGNKNIYVYRMNMQDGSLAEAGPATQIAHPSFLALSSDHKFLYAVTEGSKDSSSLSAFSVEPESGKLTFLNKQPAGGSGPCHVAVDPTGKALLAANYGSGSMSAFPVKADGSLGPKSGFFQGQGSSVDPQRQEGPHAHCVVTDPNDRFALLCDLGLDKVFVFKFDPARATITPNNPGFVTVKAGSGPRHIVFDPNGRFAYLACEMASTVSVLGYDAQRGILRLLQTESMLPPDFTAPNTAAEIAVHPTGRFVYASNRGHNSIVEFTADPVTGHLTRAGWFPTEGKTPRNFAIDPTGTFLLAANQDSNTVIVFKIDQGGGGLLPTGQKIEVDTPMCVTFCDLL